ncbi:transposase [Kalymmatonema gypsitolerans NIES-4073]|nr:transposase [Scytonema sp. NIES-4073]
MVNATVEGRASGAIGSASVPWAIGTTVAAVNPRMTSQKCSDCGAIVKKSLSTRTHKCACGCELQRDVNAAINILNLAKARDGQSRSNATGVVTSTLFGETALQEGFPTAGDCVSAKRRLRQRVASPFGLKPCPFALGVPQA